VRFVGSPVEPHSEQKLSGATQKPQWGNGRHDGSGLVHGEAKGWRHQSSVQLVDFFDIAHTVLVAHTREADDWRRVGEGIYTPYGARLLTPKVLRLDIQ